MGKYFNKELFGKRLQEVMTENNETTYSLGDYLQLSSATISRYCTGEISSKIPTVQAIAIKFVINPAWLMGTEGASKYDEGFSRNKRIPLVGTIAAGQPILAQQNIEGYEYVGENDHVDFCLRVKGDSMINARIFDGDLVYIRQQPDVENGEIAAVIIDNEEATLKRIYKVDGSVILHPENPSYQDKIISKKDKKSIRILGKAVLFKSEVR